MVFHQGSAFEVISGQEWIIDIASLNQQAKVKQLKLVEKQQGLFFELEKNSRGI